MKVYLCAVQEENATLYSTKTRLFAYEEQAEKYLESLANKKKKVHKMKVFDMGDDHRIGYYVTVAQIAYTSHFEFGLCKKQKHAYRYSYDVSDRKEDWFARYDHVVVEYWLDN